MVQLSDSTAKKLLQQHGMFRVSQVCEYHEGEESRSYHRSSEGRVIMVKEESSWFMSRR